MPRVRIEEVKEGMQLDRAVTDERGAALVPAGTVLTADQIQQIRSVGAHEVFVAPPRLSDQEKDTRRRDLQARSDRMFKGHEGEPLMQAIARTALDVLQKKL